VPVDRELSAECIHRVPYVGRRMVLESFPAYFKVGQLSKSGVTPLPKNNKSFFSNWFKRKETKKFDPLKLVVTPRFIVFEDGFLIFLKYHKPHLTRDFGFYDTQGVQKKLPEMKFDAEVTYSRHLRDLYKLDLVNVKKKIPDRLANLDKEFVTVHLHLANMIELIVDGDDPNN